MDVIAILSHDQAQLIIDVLEDHAECFRKVGERATTPDSEEAQWIAQAEACESLALLIHKERLAAGA